MKHDRIEWIDILKGFGILSVVAGHVFTGYLSSVIFLYHMPLFFVISGYLHKPARNKKEFFIRKSIHLLLPYFTFLFILYSIDTFRHLETGPALSTMKFVKICARAILGGRMLEGWTGVFWFITCLFLTQQIFNFLLLSFARKKVILISVFCLAFSYINARLIPDLFLPWNANVSIAALPFFAIGYFSQKIKLRKTHFIPAGAIVSIAFLLIMGGVEVSYNMKSADYGIPVVSFIFSCSIILLWVLLSKSISSSGVTGRILTAVGSASMVIMYLHQPIQMSMSEYGMLSNEWLRFVFSTGLSFAFFLLCKRYTFSRAVFLGSREDVYILKGNSHKNNLEKVTEINVNHGRT